MKKLLSDEAVRDIESKINYKFENKSLLYQAFSRSSYTNEQKQTSGIELPSNEVLEFCGDSILGASVVTLLLRRYGEITEDRGFLSRFGEGSFSTFKSNMSDKSMLSERMDCLGLHRYLLMSCGDRERHIAEQPSVKEDLFESIVGAVYMDTKGDFAATAAVVGDMLDPDAFLCKEKPQKNVKNLLQEYCQQKKIPWQYETVSVTGPEHEPCIRVRCTVNGRAYYGEGSNTKKAEISAARAACAELLQNNSAETPAAADPASHPRTRLKEYCDRHKKKMSFAYTETAHDSVRYYRAELAIDGIVLAVGEGGSKKDAAKAASEKVLAIIEKKK